MVAGASKQQGKEGEVLAQSDGRGDAMSWTVNTALPWVTRLTCGTLQVCEQQIAIENIKSSVCHSSSVEVSNADEI